MLLQAEQMHKMTSISLKMAEVVILSENSCHFVYCSACKHSYFLLSFKLEISHVLNGTTSEIQHRKWGTWMHFHINLLVFYNKTYHSNMYSIVFCYNLCSVLFLYFFYAITEKNPFSTYFLYTCHVNNYMSLSFNCLLKVYQSNLYFYKVAKKMSVLLLSVYSVEIRISFYFLMY